ncbi:S8 family serine peptidase [Deinococcus budaensis]|uniref:Subtilisin family serine protease n=1 Tax=Deinococcus budaensis TaxID=1665626 RepID=A0A7W8GCK7_9DEIO|nr:S8 family serine peptidase [Deinococcus budaensis]MBB5232861.1 subtilisin family serine protease [Deinococcus budaensis]
MKRLSPVLTALLLLASCAAPPAPPSPPPVTPPVTPGAPTCGDTSQTSGASLTAPARAAALPVPRLTPASAGSTLALGTALGGELTQAFTGRWELDRVPDWLSVQPARGEGNVALKVTADRARATPTAADQPQLSGEVSVTWQQGTQSGRFSWTVTADQYTLTGRVLDAARAQGTDAGTGGDVAAQGTAAARGVIVKYRSAAAQAVALGRAAPAGTLSGAAQATTLDTLAGLGAGRGALADLGGRRLHLQTNDVAGALRALRSDPNVEYAVPNALLRAQAEAAPVVPTDQYAGLQWAYKLLGYPAVWRDMEAGSYTRPVTVAVIDSGVRFDHPDLAGQFHGPGEGALDVLCFAPPVNGAGGYDNGDGDGVDTDPTDPGSPTGGGGSHGTHVSGIIAARWGQIGPFPGCPECSTSGGVGASYKAPVKVLPIRVIDAAGDAEIADVVTGLRYAAGLEVTLEGQAYRTPHPAQVINLSLGAAISADTARPLCEAVADATRAGALVVVAAGNGYGTAPFYPAACEGAVAVGAVTLSGASAPAHARYSNRYAQVQLSAPGGVDLNPATFYNGAQLNGDPYADVILSTDWDYTRNQPTYMGHSGTSQAAPQVSALAALLLSKGVTQGREDTLKRLVDTATDLGAEGRDPQFGHGMVNAAAALGAPAISDTLGLRVQDSRGLAFQPRLDALGRFNAYLPDGIFRVVAGRDRDGNGIYGEAHEPRTEREADLGPGQVQVDLGDLTPTP